MQELMESQQLSAFFKGGLNNLTGHKEEINALNVYPVPDGDTGTNMGLTIKSAAGKVSGDMTVEQICSEVSRGALMGARGNSGVILSQILRGFTMGLKAAGTIDGTAFAAALNKGVEIAYKSVLKPVEGTILTVSRCSAEAAVKAAETEKDIEIILESACKAGKEALDRTPEQLPVLKEAGVVDAGGKGFLCFLEGGLAGIRGEELSDVVIGADDGLVVKDKIVAFSSEIQEKDIKFHYCTELMIHNAAKDYEYVRANIVKAVEGDSLVCVGDEGIIKVHYHSNDPGKIISFALGIGELFDIKVENMKEQMAREAAEKKALSNKDKVKCAVIAVSSGSGISEIFESLGVRGIISGGQTMNPSAEDILNAARAINAEEYIILPNNSNVILGAKQAAELSEVPMLVVPSKYMTQGFAAMMSFNAESCAEDNASAMVDAMGDVQNGEVTFAVRDTVTDGIVIKEGDYLAMTEGRIVSAELDKEDAVFSVIDHMDKGDASLLTFYYGSDISEDEAEKLAAKAEEVYEDLDVEIYSGGQPLYDYLISLE